MSDVISPKVVSEFERLDLIVREKGALATAHAMEMWDALFEIYRKQLWRARFERQEEWVQYVAGLGVTGMGRSSIFSKLGQMTVLVNEGAAPTLAAAAVSLIPGAVYDLGSHGDVEQARHGQALNEYLTELMQLPPGEAVARVRHDKGNYVEMYLGDRYIANDRLLTELVRWDENGRTDYDITIIVKPRDSTNQLKVLPVLQWMTSRLGIPKRGKYGRDTEKTA